MLEGEEDELVPTQAEVGELKTLVHFFEYENQKFKVDVESLQVVRQKQQERITAYEKNAQKLAKRITSLEKTISLERRGVEGLKKKCGLLEVDLPGLREEITNFKSEQLRSRGLLAQQEVDLNNDRAKRLQILHENQILVDRNKHLEEQFRLKEEELVESRKSQLGHLQTLDSAVSSESTLQLLIKEQNSSLITMAAELQNVQTQCRDLTQTNHSFSTEVGQLNMTVKTQEDEIRRLRGIILMNQTKSASLRNTASRSGTAGGTGTGTLGRSGSRATSRTGTRSLSQTQKSMADVEGMLLDPTVERGGFGGGFSKSEKMAVYKNRTPGCDSTKHSRAAYVSTLSNSKQVKPPRYESESESGSEDEGVEKQEEEEEEVAAPLRTFGFAREYIDPQQELDELNAYNQQQAHAHKHGAPPLSPVANPYLPVNNKIINNKNSLDNSRPSSTQLTGPSARRGSRSGKYDFGSLGLSGELGGLKGKLNSELAKSMPHLPGLGAGQAAGATGGAPSPGAIYGAAAAMTVSQNFNQLHPGLPTTAPAAKPADDVPVNLNATAPSALGKKSSAGTLSSSSSAKSLYVGQGLGMKHKNTTQYNLPKGSTKSMLQKILGDRDDLL